MAANKRATNRSPQSPQTQAQQQDQETEKPLPGDNETSKCEASSDPMRCCHCCSSSSTSGTKCPRRTAKRPTVLLGAPVSPLLWGVRQHQPRPIDDGHYMLDKTKPLNLAPVAPTNNSHTVHAPSTAGGWPSTHVPANSVVVAATAAQWRPSFFQCCYSYASGVLWQRQRQPFINRSRLQNEQKEEEEIVARIGVRSSSSDDV